MFRAFFFISTSFVFFLSDLNRRLFFDFLLNGSFSDFVDFMSLVFVSVYKFDFIVNRLGVWAILTVFVIIDNRKTSIHHHFLGIVEVDSVGILLLFEVTLRNLSLDWGIGTVGILIHGATLLLVRGNFSGFVQSIWTIFFE